MRSASYFYVKDGFMPTVNVRNSRSQHYKWRGITFPANVEITVDALVLRRWKTETLDVYGSCGLEWDENELQTALEQFKSTCFAEFESMELPAVKASVATGEFSKGDKHELAVEWIERKELCSAESKFSSSRMDVRNTHKISILVAVAAAVTAIIVAIIRIKFGK